MKTLILTTAIVLGLSSTVQAEHFSHDQIIQALVESMTEGYNIGNAKGKKEGNAEGKEEGNAEGKEEALKLFYEYIDRSCEVRGYVKLTYPNGKRIRLECGDPV